jgi:hypothetical protein
MIIGEAERRLTIKPKDEQNHFRQSEQFRLCASFLDIP